MRRETLVAVVCASALSSAGTALAIEATRPAPVDAATGDTRIVRELQRLNFSVGRTDPQFPAPRSLREQLREICKNTATQIGESAIGC